MKQTTIRVTRKEHISIIETAEKEGLPALTRYIPYLLSESLPLDKIDNNTRTGKSDRIGIYLPEDIDKLVSETIERHSTRFKKYTLQDVVLTVVLQRVKELGL